MSRDHTKLMVFGWPTSLSLMSIVLPSRCLQKERYGLQAHLRRAAVRVPATIVEGCARRTTKDYLHFVTMALGSASEVRYLLGLASRLDYLDSEAVEPLRSRYSQLVRGLQKLLNALEWSPEPGAWSPHETRTGRRLGYNP